MKKIMMMVAMALTILPATLSAQATGDDNQVKAYVQADLISHYMWRGQDKGGISIQPQVGIAWKGLSLTGFGNAGFDKEDAQELDLTLQYEKWGFNIGVTDYWQTGIDEQDRYIFYEDKKTAHTFEGNIGYTCKYGSIQAYTMFWGHDYKADGDRAFSTYVELSVPFRAGGLDWDLRAGITPMESAATPGKTVIDLAGKEKVVEYNYFYGENFTCNRASIRATKTLHYKHVKLPVYAELHTNPYMKKANLMVGLSVIAF